MIHQARRERLERDIEDHRRELQRALRDLTLSLVLVNLPQRIRRRPFAWALAAAGVGTWLVLRARKRKRERARSNGKGWRGARA
jgi:hypothetical protein